jgi:hypothetical protein
MSHVDVSPRWAFLLVSVQFSFFGTLGAAAVSRYTAMETLFAVAAALLYVPVGALGIVGLYMDTDAILGSTCGDGWAPRPLRYLLWGALPPFVGLSALLFPGASTPSAVMTRLVFVVLGSLVLSPVAFGPVYLYNRFRRVGEPWAPSPHLRI